MRETENITNLIIAAPAMLHAIKSTIVYFTTITNLGEKGFGEIIYMLQRIVDFVESPKPRYGEYIN